MLLLCKSCLSLTFILLFHSFFSPFFRFLLLPLLFSVFFSSLTSLAFFSLSLFSVALVSSSIFPAYISTSPFLSFFVALIRLSSILIFLFRSVVCNWSDRTAAAALAMAHDGVFFSCLLEDLMLQTSLLYVADVMCKWKGAMRTGVRVLCREGGGGGA